jgi:DNA-directed RNA polymerase alpha subunit
VRVGRGFATGDENKRPDQPIGLIAIDSIFLASHAREVRVENTVSVSAPTTTSSSSKSGPTVA